VAYYLAISGSGKKVTLIDQGAAMGFTSVHSGENYRNWWPHPVMRALTDLSIDLLEDIAGATSNRINMSRRGYVLATRSADIGEFLAASQENVRVHTGVKAQAYGPPLDWESAPDGVDVLANSALINSHFPYFDENVRSVIHIRRGGDIAGQQLGQFMLEQIRERGGQLAQTRVLNIARDSNFIIEANGQIIRADVLVNAAGPFAGTIAEMLGVTLPITNVLQQKIAFIDEKQAIARTMPFSVDLDGQKLDWEEDERALLLENPDTAWLTRLMPGAIHCRPDGGVNGKWIRLGWAYNQRLDTPVLEPLLDDSFPEIVLRGAARLNPALKAYYGHLPRNGCIMAAIIPRPMKTGLS
jgi:glycine/D-amino acid oxidase-like deaminating enzyme